MTSTPKPPRQIISIGPDGSLVGLDHKKKGLDLRQFGKAKTERATLIEWDENRQKWFVNWNDGPTWTVSLFRDLNVCFFEYKGELVPTSYDMNDHERVVYFEDYEDAVSAEVAVIQAMQLNGEEIA